MVLLMDKNKPLTEGQKIYLEVVERLKFESEEKVKDYLKKKYSLSVFTASSLVSAAKRGLNEYFEIILNNSKKA